VTLPRGSGAGWYLARKHSVALEARRMIHSDWSVVKQANPTTGRNAPGYPSSATWYVYSEWSGPAALS
jgi:hypothetical protein